VQGNRSLVEFCREHGIKHEVCGKVIVATKPSELPLLDNLFQRGLNHELVVARLSPEQVQEIEPHVRCVAGIKIPSAGIVNYREVSAKYVELVKSQGGTVRAGTRVDRIREVGDKELNRRFDPANGAISPDANLAYDPTDPACLMGSPI